MIPMNTDGIDPLGQNIIIRNVTITNYDDAVSIKATNNDFKNAKCSQNILVENCRVTLSMGMAIGSVDPHPSLNCVKDVIFRNITFNSPIKAVYVKTMPGGGFGKGLIQNITY